MRNSNTHMHDNPEVHFHDEQVGNEPARAESLQQLERQRAKRYDPTAEAEDRQSEAPDEALEKVLDDETPRDRGAAEDSGRDREPELTEEEVTARLEKVVTEHECLQSQEAFLQATQD